jgi:predicted nucleic acid-binding protein
LFRLIDTSVAIALREVEDAVSGRFAALDRLPLISVLSLVELEGGVVTAGTGRKLRQELLEWIANSLEVVAFEQRHAAVYGQIIGHLGFSRTRIIDRMIAAQAIVVGATVATLNPRDFRDIPGLTIEDWSS